MKSSRFDLGLAFGLAVAGSLTVIFAWIAYSEGRTPSPYFHGPIWPLYALGVPGLLFAWLGVWAWWKHHWLVAALGFFLSLATPVGYLVELTGPVAVGLMIVALFRAWRDRGPRRRRMASVDP